MRLKFIHVILGTVLISLFGILILTESDKEELFSVGVLDSYNGLEEFYSIISEQIDLNNNVYINDFEYGAYKGGEIEYIRLDLSKVEHQK